MGEGGVVQWLQRNRALRNYLKCYPQAEVNEVVKLTLLYGVISLQKRSPGHLFSVDELRLVTSSAASAAAVESSLPELKQQLEELQEQLEEVTEEIYQPADRVG